MSSTFERQSLSGAPRATISATRMAPAWSGFGPRFRPRSLDFEGAAALPSRSTLAAVGSAGRAGHPRNGRVPVEPVRAHRYTASTIRPDLR
jgi:hypothetical protein